MKKRIMIEIATGNMSWAAGTDFANTGGADLVELTTTLATNMWQQVAGGNVRIQKQQRPIPPGTPMNSENVLRLFWESNLW